MPEALLRDGLGTGGRETLRRLSVIPSLRFCTRRSGITRFPSRGLRVEDQLNYSEIDDRVVCYYRQIAYPLCCAGSRSQVRYACQHRRWGSTRAGRVATEWRRDRPVDGLTVDYDRWSWMVGPWLGERCAGCCRPVTSWAFEVAWSSGSDRGRAVVSHAAARMSSSWPAANVRRARVPPGEGPMRAVELSWFSRAALTGRRVPR